MTKRNVMIRMLVSRLEIPHSLFDGEDDVENYEPFELNLFGEMPEPEEMLLEGRLLTNATRVELLYEESELTGMEGSVTAVVFQRRTPHMLTMMRTGSVRTAMVFEEGKRHICLYNTPFSTFEVCVSALKVQNELLAEGRIELDYLVEIHGAQAEHCHMVITVQDDGAVFSEETK